MIRKANPRAAGPRPAYRQTIDLAPSTVRAYRNQDRHRAAGHCRCGGAIEPPYQTCLRCRDRLAVKHRVRRAAVLAHYGGCCACCGEAHEAFLTMDHIDGNGAEERRQRQPEHHTNLYYWLVRHGFPGGFQILCYNCNYAKGKRGRCPHETPMESPAG